MVPSSGPEPAFLSLAEFVAGKDTLPLPLSDNDGAFSEGDFLDPVYCLGCYNRLRYICLATIYTYVRLPAEAAGAPGFGLILTRFIPSFTVPPRRVLTAHGGEHAPGAGRCG